MDDKESLNFKIGLSGTSSNKKPLVIIKVNETEYFNGFLTADKGVTEYIEFSAEINEGSHELHIIFCNKEDSDTVKDHTDQIVDDFLLNIDSIEIDEIDLGILKWTISNYRPVYSPNFADLTQRQITDVKNCVNLGWNGTWSLPFTSPFYVWLLENI